MDLTGVTVLVVYDEPDTRELLGLMLSTCGASVRVAASARGAVVACDEQTPDVILSDLGMPEHDGYALLETLRTRPACARVPTIAVTGYADHRDRALAAGFADFLLKPVEPEALCQRVARQVLS